VRDRIHDEFPTRACVGELANEFDVHPVYLARAFRARYGCTITQYSHRLRVYSAADRIASTRLPLASVATGAGFADQSHLSRLFKRETGLTPASFRRIAQSSEV
jgi:AraC family transcriptional regulator